MDVSVDTNCIGCHRHVACNAKEGEVHPGDYCVIETERGVFLGKVRQVLPRLAHKSEDSCDCKVLRKATPEDIESANKTSVLEKKAFSFCQQRINVRELPMKLVGVEHLLDGSKAVFYFTADGRVDFRELVRDLAYELRTRIEMKQIGVRDEAKMLGGYGCCGLDLCCATFLKDFEPVSIRMAKIQNLTLDPTKISGACGRLMCCLGYEHEDYEKLRKLMPKLGETITVEGEPGKVRHLDILKETITIAFKDGKTVKYSLEEIQAKKTAFRGKKTVQKAKDTPQANSKKGNLQKSGGNKR